MNTVTRAKADDDLLPLFIGSVIFGKIKRSANKKNVKSLCSGASSKNSKLGKMSLGSRIDIRMNMKFTKYSMPFKKRLYLLITRIRVIVYPCLIRIIIALKQKQNSP